MNHWYFCNGDHHCFFDQFGKTVHVYEVDESMAENQVVECECGNALSLKCWISPEQKKHTAGPHLYAFDGALKVAVG